MIIQFFSVFILLHSSGMNCRLGENAPLTSQPNCGIPRRLRLELPQGGRRFEFRRNDNPGLNGYFVRRRDSTGAVKRFSNLVNLYKVDIFLCPEDFKTSRTLLFHLLKGGKVKKVQCNLGGNKTISVPGKTVTNVVSPVMNESSMAVTKLKTSVPDSPDTKKSIISGNVVPPEYIPAKKDPFARFLAWLALGFSGFLALVLIGMLVWFSVKLNRINKL
ncbi:MAG: hypothetical protein JXR95_04940 [Deltaproteobacteria bacterium]|nr:hypothetical protein [Deltaproteobacteria bacterium]